MIILLNFDRDGIDGQNRNINRSMESPEKASRDLFYKSQLQERNVIINELKKALEVNYIIIFYQ